MYKRKYHHDFTLPLNSKNMEGAIGMELNKINAFVVAHVDTMKIYDQNTFTEIEVFPIELLKDTKNREPNQVL